MRRWLWASLTVAACAPDGKSGTVLLTLEARSAGAALLVDGRRLEPILPREFSDSDVRLVGLGDEELLDLPPGTVAVVNGGGDLDWIEPGLDFEADQLLLDGPEAAARELGEALGAGVEEWHGGLWRVMGPDVVQAAALVDEPDGLVEARLVEAPPADLATAIVLPLPSELSPVSALTLSAPLVDPDETGQAERNGDEAPDQVGIFEQGGVLRVVDAAGGTRVLCTLGDL